MRNQEVQICHGRQGEASWVHGTVSCLLALGPCIVEFAIEAGNDNIP
jgi:hypothetical protein